VRADRVLGTIPPYIISTTPAAASVCLFQLRLDLCQRFTERRLVFIRRGTLEVASSGGLAL